MKKIRESEKEQKHNVKNGEEKRTREKDAKVRERRQINRKR